MPESHHPAATLHPQLAADCIVLGRFPLSLVLLMNDANFPWFILVPDRKQVSEIYQLSTKDQACLQRESGYLAAQLAEMFSADKMNIAALGNIVPQLHIHHIVRYTHDPVWPAPVWGKLPAIPYTDSAIEDIHKKLTRTLKNGYISL
jgi:diadenosine tetraphosphate (Ap4A) HIT family hydrolase